MLRWARPLLSQINLDFNSLLKNISKKDFTAILRGGLTTPLIEIFGSVKVGFIGIRSRSTLLTTNTKMELRLSEQLIDNGMKGADFWGGRCYHPLSIIHLEKA